MAENKIMSVVTLPLKTEKWQEDILQKRFELCRKIYNNKESYKGNESYRWQYIYKRQENKRLHK